MGRLLCGAAHGPEGRGTPRDTGSGLTELCHAFGLLKKVIRIPSSSSSSRLFHDMAKIKQEPMPQTLVSVPMVAGPCLYTHPYPQHLWGPCTNTTKLTSGRQQCPTPHSPASAVSALACSSASSAPHGDVGGRGQALRVASWGEAAWRGLPQANRPGQTARG